MPKAPARIIAATAKNTEQLIAPHHVMRERAEHGGPEIDAVKSTQFIDTDQRCGQSARVWQGQHYFHQPAIGRQVEGAGSEGWVPVSPAFVLPVFRIARVACHIVIDQRNQYQDQRAYQCWKGEKTPARLRQEYDNRVGPRRRMDGTRDHHECDGRPDGKRDGPPGRPEQIQE